MIEYNNGTLFYILLFGSLWHTSFSSTPYVIFLSMPQREHDSTLPAIPENSEAKLGSWNNEDEDDDAEDSEEQGLFEQDNDDVVTTVDDNGVGGDSSSSSDGGFDDDNNTHHPIPIDDDDDDAANGGNVDNNGHHANGDPSPLYVRSPGGDSWELTWPIWHMLPRDERRAIAANHGMKSIGEFEEYMILTRAVDDSGGGAEGGGRSTDDTQGRASTDDGPSSSALAAPPRNSSDANWHPPFIGKAEEEEDDDDDDDEDDESDSAVEDAAAHAAASTRESAGGANDTTAMDHPDDHHLELIRLGGLPCSLPDEVLHKVFSCLPIDDHASLALVSPHWSRFARCESLYRTLCQRVYLRQSKRKTLHVSRFGNSYRRMLEMRPRVRAGGGLYVF